MAPRYQVRLKDVAGNLVAVLTDWYNLGFRHQVNGVGWHSLTIDGDLAKVDLFDLDGQVEVWRSDIEAGIELYLEYEGFHRTPIRQTDAAGRSTFISRGKSYNDLLARRVILYPTGSAQASKSDVGETVMKEYVDENAGPSATSPPRLLSSGVMAGLSIQADGAAGGSWTGERAFRSLLDVLIDVSKDTAVDFGIVGTGAALFEFQAQASPWGKDRTTSGLDESTGLNAAGNAPVVFSLDYGNMGAPTYSKNRGSEVTAVIVLGQGQEDDQEVIERTNAAAIAESTWNRIETPVQGNLEDSIAGLDSVGDAILKSVQAREVFDFEVLQIPSTLYGKNYFLGDLVTARYKGIERDKKIVAVEIQTREGNETITVGLSDVPLS